MSEESRQLTFVGAAAWTIGAVLLRDVAIMATEAARPGAMTDLINVTACELLAYSAFTFVILRLYAPTTRVREAVALRPVGPLAILGAAILGAGLSPAMELADEIVAKRFPAKPVELEFLANLLAVPTTSRRAVLGVAFLAVLPAIQEVFFRGILFGRLRESPKPPAASLVILGVAVYFTAAGASPQTVVSVFVLGVLLAWLRDRTRSIVPTFVAHAAFYAVPVVPILLGRDPSEDVVYPRLWILGGLGAAAIVAAIFEWRARAARASALVGVALLFLLPRPADACATVSRGDAVGITREEALIVWDEAAHTERFIRRAQFATNEKDFGFLVPTPAPPELAEASDAVFDALDRTIEREREHVTETDWDAGCLFMLARKSSAPIEAGAVHVLATATVAGLDAAVLQADSASALGEWLRAHAYAERPEISKWLAPYVEAKWTITAFKYAEGEGRPAPELLSKAVMLTFRAERPLFPYREPPDAAPQWGRLLRVFLVAATRMEGTLGDARAAWPGEVVYASPLKDDLVAKEMPKALLPANAWITALNDRSITRPAAGDLYFTPAQDRAPVKPPPIVHTRRIYVPLELVAFVLVVGALVARVVVRRRARARG